MIRNRERMYLNTITLRRGQGGRFPEKRRRLHMCANRSRKLSILSHLPYTHHDDIRDRELTRSAKLLHLDTLPAQIHNQKTSEEGHQNEKFSFQLRNLKLN